MDGMTVPQTRISGESAVSGNDLPTGWQAIAYGTANTGLTDPQAYVQMAQLFLYKMQTGDVDIFNKRSDLTANKSGFTAVMAQLALETLTFYAADFDRNRYPNFEALEDEVKGNTEHEKIVAIARDLFSEFGYDLPASFYRVHLAPLARGEVCEIRPLRFSEEDKENARAWDASLHAQKVFPMQMRIQSISSQHGFLWEHGCGCNHGLARVSRTQQPFHYVIRPEMRTTWLRDFVWTMWYEYAFFQFVPVTRFLTGEILEFT